MGDASDISFVAPIKPQLLPAHGAHGQVDAACSRALAWSATPLAYLTAPMVSPRTRARCATQPAMKTGAIATVDAADILAQKSPSLVMKLEM
jgi:hypothetical protein